MKRNKLFFVAGAACAAVPASIVCAGAHTWDVVEIFSTADGSIQFIEMQEQNGTNGEWHLQGLHVRAMPTGGDFIFPDQLPATTANKHLLLATAGFAALPNAPTPDLIIPANFFNPSGGDTVSYHVYDSWVIASGQIPTDCMNSLNRDGTTGVPTPMNYNGDSPAGPIDYCPAPKCPADITDAAGSNQPDGNVNIFDLLMLLGNWNSNGPGADIAAPEDVVNVFDLLELLSTWGACS